MAAHPGTLTAGAASYRASLADAAERAGLAAGWSEHDLRIGPRSLRLRLAGEALAPLLLPALRHALGPSGGEPEATLSVWDSVSSGVAGPDQPWRPDDVLGRTEVRGFDGVAQDPGTGLVSAFDPGSRQGVLWVPDPARVAWYERAAPFRALLNWALAGPSSRLVHAGAVGDERAGALLAGRGGSGKSTLALACAQRGLGFAGDDYVVLDGRTAHALYATAKVDERALGLLDLATRAFPPHGADGEKAVLAIDRLQPAVALTAVVLPSIGGERPTLQPVSGAEALRALAPSTIFQLPPTADPLAPLAALVREAPSYRLELGPDPHAAAGLVEELLA